MKRLKQRLINALTRTLIPLVEDKEIISFNKQGDVFIGTTKLTETELNTLRQEAKFLKESQIWKIINIYFTQLAKKKLFEESKDIDDLLFAKTMLYTLSVQNIILDKIKKN